MLRIIHRYLGLLLVLPLVVQGVTGAILAFEPIMRDFDTVPVAGSERAPPSVDAIVAAAREVAPEDMRAARYVPPRSGAPAEVWFAPSTGQRGAMIVRVNVETMLPIWPPESQDGPLEWVRRLHTGFLLQEFGGRSIVGWAGVGLLLLTLTGIPIWWPAAGKWRSAFTVSRTARGILFHRRLHGAAGIWFAIFLLVSSATGAVLGFPRMVRAALGLSQPIRVGAAAEAARGRSPDAAAGAGSKLDAAQALAGIAAPGTVLRMLMLPASAGGPMRVFLAPPGAEGVARMSVVTVDGKASRIIGIQDPRTMPPAEQSLRWMHDIHFGQGLGLLWRVPTILTGLALPVFAVTGTAMWLLRKRNRKRAGFAGRNAQRDVFSPGE